MGWGREWGNHSWDYNFKYYKTGTKRGTKRVGKWGNLRTAEHLNEDEWQRLNYNLKNSYLPFLSSTATSDT